MDKYDRELNEIRYQKYLICMQINELKKQLSIKRQEESRLIEEKTMSRKRGKTCTKRT